LNSDGKRASPAKKLVSPPKTEMATSASHLIVPTRSFIAPLSAMKVDTEAEDGAVSELPTLQQQAASLGRSRTPPIILTSTVTLIKFQ